jgi:hypothetical protein
MKQLFLKVFSIACLLAVGIESNAQTKELDRTILPIPHVEHPAITEPEV